MIHKKQIDLIGIVIAVALAASAAYLIYLIRIPNTPEGAKNLNPVAAAGEAVGAQVGIHDISVGTGEMVQGGDTLTIHYVGALQDGTKFDSSYDRNATFDFVLGEHKVIPGLEQGVQGMRVGGKREITIPPQLAYGDRAVGNKIPPNSTLRFTVELISLVHVIGQ